jgi:hypothetical protein
MLKIVNNTNSSVVSQVKSLENPCSIQLLSNSKMTEISFEQLLQILGNVSDQVEKIPSKAQYLLNNMDWLVELVMNPLAICHLNSSQQKRIRIEAIWNLCSAVTFCKISAEEIRGIIDLDLVTRVLSQALKPENFPSASLISYVHQTLHKLYDS